MHLTPVSAGSLWMHLQVEPRQKKKYIILLAKLQNKEQAIWNSPSLFEEVFSHPHKKFMNHDGNLEYIKNCAEPFNVHHKRSNMRKAYNA